MRKSIVCIMVVLLLSTLLAACAPVEVTQDGAEEATKAEETAKAEEPKEEAPKEEETVELAESGGEGLSGEITFWHCFTQGTRFDVINEAAETFMEENPNVKVNIEVFSWGDFYTKWTTGLASGNVPDMSTGLPTHVVEMIDADALLPLNNLIDEIGRDRFSEPAIIEGTVDGNNYSVPLYSHAQVMWYRQDLLDAAGLDVPKTWDEFYETSKELTKDGIYGCSFPTGSGDIMGSRYLNFYVQSCGERLLTDDNKANLTSEAAIEGIKYWVQMYKDCSPEDSINYKVLDQAQLFYNGQTAFDFNSGFHIGGINNNSPDLIDDIGCTYLPVKNEGDPVYGGETSNIPLVIWKNAESPEVCAAFIQYLYEDDRYIDFLEAVPVGMLPALSDIATNEKYLANETVQQFSDVAETISSAVAMGTSIGMETGPSVEAGLLTSQGIIESMFQDILVNGTPVEEAAAAAEAQLNEIFESVQ